MRDFARRLLVTVPGIVRALAIVRVPIVATIALAIVFVLPSQTEEDYRAVVQNMWAYFYFDCGSSLWSTAENCSRLKIVRESIMSLLGVIGTSIAVWYATFELATRFRGRLRSNAYAAQAILQWSPKVLPAVLLLSLAAGIFLSRPFDTQDATRAAIREVAERRLVMLRGADALNDENTRTMIGIVERFTSFSGTLTIGAAVMAMLAIAAFWFLPGARVQQSAAAAPTSTLLLRPGGSAVVLALAIAAFLLFLLFPVIVPDFLGPLAVFSLFAICTVLLLAQLSFWSDKRRIPAITILVVWSMALSFLGINNNHGVRADVTKGEAPSQAGAKAPMLNEQFEAWFRSRTDAGKYVQRRYPVYVVAAQGGGVYASYHAARLLASLQDRCPLLAQHLFAVSGVSGGSVGAALFGALRLTDPAPVVDIGTAVCNPAVNQGNDRGTLRYAVAETLGRDLLSPLLAGMLFPDFLQLALPFPVPSFDRSRWLELSLEQALQATYSEFGKNLKSEFWKNAVNHLARPYIEHWRPEGGAPALLLNTTEVSTGDRRIIAPFIFGPDTKRFLPLWDEKAGLRGIRLSTAAVLSARYPWVTPSAAFAEVTDGSQRDVQLVDGGYYDNSGVATAFELKQSLEAAAVALGIGDKIEVKLIVLTAEPSPDRGTSRFRELLDPVRAALHSWRTRSRHTIKQAQDLLQRPPGTIPVMRVVYLENIPYYLPLGWRLSAGTMYLMDAQDPIPGRCVNEAVSPRARYGADCLLKDIVADLQ